MERQYGSTARRTGAVWVREDRRHRLNVGARVILLNEVKDPRAKGPKEAPGGARFEVTRLLPAEGATFQYRIKDIATGHERVVMEDQITASF